MSRVTLSISMALGAVAAGLATAALKITLTDSNGNSAINTVPASDFPTPNADGTFTVSNSFDSVLPGYVSGEVQAVDAGGSPVGSAVFFTGTASGDPANMQPVPIAVSLS